MPRLLLTVMAIASRLSQRNRLARTELFKPLKEKEAQTMLTPRQPSVLTQSRWTPVVTLLAVGMFGGPRSYGGDPALVYSTYLGGSSPDNGFAVAVDGSGNTYVAGSTASSDFPATTGAFDVIYNGGTSDGFVAKFGSTGNLLWATFLGGCEEDSIRGIAVDEDGSAYVTGFTYSGDFPTTAGAFQQTYNGVVGRQDAFVAKLDASGANLLYATYLGGGMPAESLVLGDGTLLGGATDDRGEAITVDADGNAYVIGTTGSEDFPTTAGAFETTQIAHLDAFVTKLNADGTALLYSTFIGGNALDRGAGIAVDADGNAYVTGDTASNTLPTTAGTYQPLRKFDTDAFVAKLDAAGASLHYSTYLGGDGHDLGLAIAVDADGNAYVGGRTQYDSGDNRRVIAFPITGAAFDDVLDGIEIDGFVTKLNAAGTALVYSTYLGGMSGDSADGIAVDGLGNAYVIGATSSDDFPTTAGAFDDTLNNGVATTSDGFLTKLDPNGANVLFSTYLGGGSFDLMHSIALDTQGNVYLAGRADSGDFPTTAGTFDESWNGGPQDAVVLKIGSPDTDDDGLLDAEEIVLGTDPLDPDTDDDGLLDGLEIDLAMGTGCPDPLTADSDQDLLQDGDEVGLGTDPCVATATEDVGDALEEMATEVLTDAIDEILADPEVPNEIANTIQEASDDVVGNNGGAANNGASDKFQENNLIAGIVQTISAVELLQDAADAGFDTTDLQALLTSFAGLAVRSAIAEAAALLGESAVQGALMLADLGDMIAQNEDFLDALNLYKAAAQALP